MDVLIFLTVVTFQVTLLAIVAIVFGQSKIAEQAIGGLTNILRSFTLKRKQLSRRKRKQTSRKSTSVKPINRKRKAPKRAPTTEDESVDQQETATEDFAEMEG